MAGRSEKPAGSASPGVPHYDRTPPQDIDAERAVLGAMLVRPQSVGSAIEVLHGNVNDLFFVPAHQVIFDGILSLFSANKAIDGSGSGIGERTQATGAWMWSPVPHLDRKSCPHPMSRPAIRILIARYVTSYRSHSLSTRRRHCADWVHVFGRVYGRGSDYCSKQR